MDKKKVDYLKFMVFIIMILAASIIIVNNWHFIKGLRIEHIVEHIDKDSSTAELLYLLIYAVKPFFFIIPANVVAIVGGTIFGPVKGFILIMIGFWISATIAFYLARFLGRGFVEGLLKNKFMKLDNDMEKKGFKILFLLRLPPVLPFDPLSYACGLTKISYKDFILASLLGVSPESLCYAIMGRSFQSPFTPQFMLPMIFLLVGTLSANFFINKSKKTN